MENLDSFEERECIIDGLIDALGPEHEMNSDDILSDIITFAPTPENEDPNPDYLEQMAEMLGISVEEMNKYALKKAEDLKKGTE
jgi:hypothetical protein